MRIIDLGSSGNVVEYEVPFLDSQNNPIEIFKGQIDVDSGVLVDEYANLASYDPESVPADLATAIEADAEEVSATPGDIVSFDCELGEYPMKSLIAYIEHVQDLHGYDNPWPGGGGKNLLDQASNVAGCVVKSNGEELTNQSTTYGRTVFIPVEPSTTYTWSGLGRVVDLVGKRGGEYSSNDFSSFVQSIEDPYSDSGTITTSASTHYVVFNVLMAGTSQQLETGSTATSFAPFANICPISGRTGADIYRTGVNVWDEEWEVGTIDTSTGENASNNQRIRSKNYISVTPGTTYYICAPTANSAYMLWYRYDASKNFIDYQYKSGGNTVTIPDNISYVRFSMVDYGTTYNNDISINYPSTDHDYHAYSGTTYALTFKDENNNPITVYGGNATYLGGGNWRLTSTMAMVDLGDYNYSLTTYKYAWTEIAGKKPGLTNFISDMLTPSTAPFDGTQTDFTIKGNTNNTRVYISVQSETTEAGYKTALTGVQLVYELATPLTYTLTTEQLTTLLGQNNVWCDAGEISELKYYDGDVNEFDDIATSKGALLTGSQVVYPRATPLTYQITPVGVDLVEGQNYIFTNTGDTTVRYAEPFSINNPTYHDARPLIRVYGIGVLWVGDYSVTISEADGYTDIDCAMMDCYKGSQNRNRYVTLSNHEYPVLKPGKNIITMGSGITKVEITPRWWRV